MDNEEFSLFQRKLIRTDYSSQLPEGLIAQLVEHCTGIAEVMGSNPVQPEFFSSFTFTTA